MKNFSRSISGGRFKTILKKSAVESWFMLFDNELTNIINQHPFTDNFTWIRPKCYYNNYIDSSLDLFSNSNFYLIKNVYPNSIFSIPFIQTAIVENDGGFISSPNTYTDSDCSFSLFKKYIKANNQRNLISEIQGVIRVPNELHKHAINIGKYLKLPPHMKKLTTFSFLKIDVCDKSYWNDKHDLRISSNDFQIETDGELSTIYDSNVDSVFHYVSSNRKFINPLVENYKNNNINNLLLDQNGSGVYAKQNINCIHCQFNLNNINNFCYCDSLQRLSLFTYKELNNSFSYYSRGTGQNPFYSSIQKQLGAEKFTILEFVGYFDTDTVCSESSEKLLLEKMSIILKLNGSPDAQISIKNVQVFIERIDSRLLRISNCGDKKKSICFISDSSYSNSFNENEKAIFIDKHFLIEYFFMTDHKKKTFSDSLIVEQIVEYFDILINQKVFVRDFEINPFDLWEHRFDQFNKISIENNVDIQLLSHVYLHDIPNEIVNINGILKPNLTYRYILFIVSQVAIGNYNWGLIHLEGVSTCNISFKYKPHGSDNNGTNSVNDLYLLIFRSDNEIFLTVITVVSNNDANL